MKNRFLVIACLVFVFILTLAACSKATAVSTSNAITVKSVTLAQDLNENFQAVNPKTQFLPTDTIFVSVDVAGRPTMGSLNGKFYYGDQLISEATLDFSSVNQGIIISIGEDTYAGFNLAPSEPWPVDTGYRFELYVNGTKIGDYPFEVIQ
jgi:uncharacterized protein YpuA (DUF1002 family)